MSGVEFLVSDDHPRLKRAICSVLTEVGWQRCNVHLLRRNALDYLPKRADHDCLQELRWLYDRRDSRRRSVFWPPGSAGAGKYRPKLV